MNQLTAVAPARDGRFVRALEWTELTKSCKHDAVVAYLKSATNQTARTS
jgi:hypothetical protein